MVFVYVNVLIELLMVFYFIFKSEVWLINYTFIIVINDLFVYMFVLEYLIIRYVFFILKKCIFLIFLSIVIVKY